MKLITRILLFLLLCIPSRLILSYLSIIIKDKLILLLYFISLLVIGLLFLYLYFTNGRLNALEGGGKTWWKSFRIIHGIHYIIASLFVFIDYIYNIKKYRYYSFYILLFDTFIGLLLFGLHHIFQIKFL